MLRGGTAAPKGGYSMYNFYFHSTPGKRLIDADTGRAVGIFDQEGYLAADEIAKACAAPLITRIQNAYPVYYPVHITVWDGNAEPIVNADVVIGEQTYKTDGDGCVSCKLAAGAYAVEICADGYEDQNDVITVENTRIHLTVGLSKARG